MLNSSFGNHKLPKDTIIINMGPAITCPSKQLGLCCIGDVKCYARKSEIQYPAVMPYRENQETYWRETEATKILTDIAKKVARRKIPTRYFRFNEAGDFFEQSDVGKLSYVAKNLKNIGITTYGYTARRDLDFTGVHFLFKGSGYDIPGATGQTKVVSKNYKPEDGWIVCPGSCRRCDICKKDVHINIAFIKH